MPVAAMRLLLIARVGRPTRSSVVPKRKKNRPVSMDSKGFGAVSYLVRPGKETHKLYSPRIPAHRLLRI